MSVEDILIQSSNIGTIKIAKIVGEAKLKKFIDRLKILETPKIELDELELLYLLYGISVS